MLDMRLEGEAPEMKAVGLAVTRCGPIAEGIP